MQWKRTGLTGGARAGEAKRSQRLTRFETDCADVVTGLMVITHFGADDGVGKGGVTPARSARGCDGPEPDCIAQPIVVVEVALVRATDQVPQVLERFSPHPLREGLGMDIWPASPIIPQARIRAPRLRQHGMSAQRTDMADDAVGRRACAHGRAVAGAPTQRTVTSARAI